MKNEAQARLKINKLLEKEGWRFFDDKNGKANIQVEIKAKIESLGSDFENTKKGFIDYLLLDKNGFPLCVLEAKKEATHPLSAKEQARDYARSKNCRFVILSNGNSHYLWDLEKGNPQPITTFPSQESLEHRQNYKPNIIDLADEKVNNDYLSQSTKLRDYQIEAIYYLQNAANNGKERFLFEMATGTGKTFLAAAVCKLFLQTGNAKRILFLVDRIELEDQAVKSFKEVFGTDYFIDTIKSKNWQHCNIIVSTVQTLLAGNRYRILFSPIDFELLISDEAHRSLGGNSRAIFEYFIGFKLGLTATPKDFLKGIDKVNLDNKNTKALEQRNLKDTYKTFGCEDGNPTYRYDLKKGVEAGFLLNPKPIDARTEITTELLSKQGYDVETENEDGEKSVANLKRGDFEKKIFNEATNRVFCECLLENGLKDPFTGEFGKTLVFCVSQKHATKITEILNELANKKWQGKYNSDFAVQVTSMVKDSGQYTKDFSANKLLGKSIFGQEKYPDYETSKARVCVTVSMMTTGYDCTDLLNVVLMRPIFSPYEFIQIKGRGTRKHNFNYQETNETKEKQEFLLLDFFANCEYFEKDFDYNKKLNLNINISSQKESDDTEVPPKMPDRVDLNKKDSIKTETVIQIGGEGMKIDNKLYPETYQQFEYVVKENKTIQKINESENIKSVEEFIKKYVFNQPTEYWTADKIRKSYEKKYKTKRKITLKEMLFKALGLQETFKNRQERLEEEYNKFIDIEKPVINDTSQKDIVLKMFFENYLSDKDFRKIIDNKTFADLDRYPAFGMEKLGTIKNLYPLASSYIKEYLPKEMAEFDFN